MPHGAGSLRFSLSSALLQIGRTEASTRCIENILPRFGGLAEPTAAIDQALAQFRDGRFLLTVLGKVKRGKSTLVNALLGRQDDLLAPVDKLPCNNVISRYVHGEQPTARVFYRTTERSGSAETIPVERIRHFVTEEGNPGNAKQVEAVEVAGPFAGFDSDLILVDTPGTGSLHEYHDALLQAFIPQSDAVIFLVTAGMPIDEDELELLRQIKDADIGKVIFAINKVDSTSATDLEDAVEHNRTFLAQAGIEVERTHRISARRAMQGDVAGSGLPELLAEVRNLLTNHKGRVLEERLRSRVAEAVKPTVRAWELEVEVAGRSATELRERLETLTTSRSGLKERGDLLERKFLSHWGRGLDRFQDAVGVCRSEVVREATARIQARAAVALNRLQRELPSLVMQSITDRLAQPSVELERELGDCCRELAAEYPQLSLQIGGGILVGDKSAALLVGTSAGAAAVAMGAGMVTAANAAAASAVTYVTTPSMIGVVASYFTGTAGPLLTTTAVPTAIPAWIAVAGGVGWTLGGIGVLAIPFAWTIAKSKQRKQLSERVPELVDQTLKYLSEERVPALRRTAEAIVEEYRLRRDHELVQLEATLKRLAEQPADPARATAVRERLESLRTEWAALQEGMR